MVNADPALISIPPLNVFEPESVTPPRPILLIRPVPEMRLLIKKLLDLLR